MTRRFAALRLVMGLAGLAALAGWAGGAQTADAKLALSVLSSRPDMVSGGDALVEISAPAGTTLVTLSAGGRDVSSVLSAGPAPNTWRGLVTGLPLGKSDLVARSGSRTARLTVTDYPITGPIFSGPHLTPYECRTEQSGLGKALDANCSAATKVDYFYRSSGAPAAFKPWPTGQRPTDIRNTTTIDGRTVPYIVKVESGTINRTIYRLAILDDPATPARQDGWNGRLAVTFGGGAGAAYNQGVNQVGDANSDLYLSRGFAHLIATELVNQLHANGVLQAESLMMLKEHFIEEYGPPKWTVGNGGSGGAIQQLVITQMYPGLLDGLQPSASFPDTTLQLPDCGLLQRVFNASPQTWTTDKQQAVIGFSAGTCRSWDASFVAAWRSNNKAGCQLTDRSLIYDKATNPKGVRCALKDMRVNILGRDKSGQAPSELDNVGVQYGLQALNDGKISVDEFLDLNERVGGFDRDGNYVAEREVADLQAVRALYRSGLINSGGGGLATVPIINYREYTDGSGDIHSRERDLVIRARLDRANGNHDNQIIWVASGNSATANPPTTAPRPSLGSQVLDAMTKWLDAMAADPAPLTPAKVVRHKPPEAVDAYWDRAGVRHNEVANTDPNTGYNRTYVLHTDPRIAAGGPWTADVFKCQLKPVRIGDYKAVFDAGQQARLKRIFPQGVCDFSKPGVGRTPFGGVWQRY